MRFTVKKLTGDVGPDLHAVVDTQNGRRIAYYTRAALAESTALRMNAAVLRERAERSEVGAWT